MKDIKLRQELFWDTDPEKIDFEKNSRYVIERIADLGNDEEVSWLVDYYDNDLLKEVILTSGAVRPRSKALWKLILEKK